MVVVATGTKKSTEEDKARIRELMGEDTVMIDDGSPRALLKIVHDYKADILIAGGRNMYTALKAKVPFLDINQEREFGRTRHARPNRSFRLVQVWQPVHELGFRRNNLRPL